MQKYPDISGTSKLEQVIAAFKQIVKIRNSDDIQAFTNLNKTLIIGRLTARVPSASNDVIEGDLVGDFCPTATYLYMLVANSGTPAWRRIAMGSF